MSKKLIKEPESHKVPELVVSQNVVILTGAGISAESGLQTFRDAGGLWCGHKVEDVATPQAFMRNPALVHEFYNMRRKQLSEVTPNAAHCALSVMERQWQGDFMLITQNVDNLHERAGSRNMLHMHGELVKARCVDSNQIFEWKGDISTDSICQCCQKIGTLRPHIVWFGEMPLYMKRIEAAIQNCDVFIAIGTSGIVYPAAGFVYEAKQAGAFTIEMSLESSNSPYFDRGLYGPATHTVSELVRHILAEPLL